MLPKTLLRVHVRQEDSVEKVDGLTTVDPASFACPTCDRRIAHCKCKFDVEIVFRD